MLLLMYHFMWTLFPLPFIPAVVLSHNTRLKRRMGLSVPDMAGKRGNIWIHALSVGEVVSAAPLVKALREAFPDRDIVFTVSTAAGMQVAGQTLHGTVGGLHTMPVDAWWAVRGFVKRVRPAVFVLVETDIWPAVLDYLKGLGVPSILVNGRISPRTYRAYKRAPWIVRRMFRPLRGCLMQSDLDRDRLLSIGLEPEKVWTAGNIKFDRTVRPMHQDERERWYRVTGLPPADPLWVAGSTHEGEEAMVLQAFSLLRAAYPLLRLILAPRDIRRTEGLMGLSRSKGLSPVKRSRISEHTGDYDVLVLDTYGELDRMYGLGWVSFVGGSLVPIGGHNLLEPASLGSPVLFGPYMQNFVFMSEAMVKAGGGKQVNDTHALYDAVKDLLDHPRKRQQMARSSMAFVAQNRGALGGVVSMVRKSIAAGTSQGGF